eukprot:CAMPEP_0198319050 /NCGR_PEP_ID=MMETSP1450-20131203/8279_1 /TAXON_ID=753684 ORGANISM="Madagascaria erythrocladiodes, Strain CCMP3234" /NCGR_SAMPLE_ID=MMETSP1450 /ASSEMBLY_ACC=CAM_ASM_001115 /LENGTH=217 /DNA_ID=CAMNT_0044022407 /DNA_START=80 /DNA_END=733 /DNA_ORIENTATION=+
MVLLGDTAPDFEADTTNGRLKFSEFAAGSWVVLFSHPGDFTPVCTTELGRAAQLESEFTKRGVKLIGLSCNELGDHAEWIKDINAYKSTEVKYPIIADPSRKVALAYGMVQSEAPTNAQGLPMTVRSVFIIGPDMKLKLTMTYPASTGRNFDEILRVVDSLQATAHKKLATPVDWKQGEDGIILPTVKGDEALELFPNFKTVELPSGKPYLRTTPMN